MGPTRTPCLQAARGLETDRSLLTCRVVDDSPLPTGQREDENMAKTRFPCEEIRLPSRRGVGGRYGVVLPTVVLVLAVAALAAGEEPAMEQYHAEPPFMAVSVKPNILLILDSSGSMNEFAYQEVLGCRSDSYYASCSCGSEAWTGYEEGTEYYGLFDPDSCYLYDNGHHYFYAVGAVDDDEATAGVTERAAAVPGQWSAGRLCFSGNWLNWWTMRRSDVAKKVLTGGKLSEGSSDVLVGTVGPDVSSLDRDQRRVFDDTLANPSNPSKSVYYTPMHSPIYSYFFVEKKPGTSQYQVVFNFIRGTACDPAHRVNCRNYDNDAADYGGENSSTCTYCDYDGFFLAVLVDETPRGIVHSLGDTNPSDGEDDSKVRLGYMDFNNNDGGKIYHYVDSAGEDNSHFLGIVNTVNELRFSGWTPTEESVYEAMRYFKQESPRYWGDFSVNDTWDPYHFNDSGEMVPCGKSFMILITDGEPNNNEDLGSSVDRSFVGDGKFYDSTNGYWSYYLDDLAFSMNTEDLRQDIDGDQTVSLYTIFAFEESEKARTYLMRASRAGGFSDLDGDGQPFCDAAGVCAESDEGWDQSFYRGTCGDTSGGDCTADSLCKEWDRDCDGVPDTFFDAQNGSELSESLVSALTDILRRTASGTAVTILSTSVQGEGSIVQAYFKPWEVTSLGDDVAETNWAGFLQGFWVDSEGRIREDNGDRKQIYADDPVIRFTFDENKGTRAERDLDGDGSWDEDNIPLWDLNPLWEGGKSLALRDPDTRSIFTLLGTAPFTNGPATTPFATENASALQYYLRAPTAADAADLVRYIRGQDLTGSRARQVYVDTDGDNQVDTQATWKLGDIVYSTPTMVSRPMENYDQLYGDSTFTAFERQYNKRPTVVYVGANDGMLHAFNVGVFVAGDDGESAEVREHGRFTSDYPGYFTSGPYYHSALAGDDGIGQEIWAYIPHSVLPHLQWLKDENYLHTYYVDLKPKVTDARIFAADSDHPSGWGTVLIGGVRLGGGDYETDDFDLDGNASDSRLFSPSYFALDITIPTDPKLLWEFSHSDLGFATTYPAIVRNGDREDPGNWYALLGSGPTDYEGNSDQTARVFVLNLKTGSLVRQMVLGSESGFVGGLSSTDLERDYNVTGVYVGESYNPGGAWFGSMHRLLVGTQTQGYDPPSGWTPSVLCSTREDQPIVSLPNIAMYNPVGTPWIFWGTGRFFSPEDKLDTSTQSFYGVKDEKLSAGLDAEDLDPTADLVETTDIDVIYGVPNVTVSGGELGSLGLSEGDSWGALNTAMVAENGWFFRPGRPARVR